MVASMDEYDDALREFQETVSVSDPALDQVFAACRDAFQQIGVGAITAREAKVALSILTAYLGAPEETRAALAAYLGTLLEIPNE